MKKENWTDIKKERAIQLLKKKKMVSTSEIAHTMKSSIDRAKDILEDLYLEGRISKIEAPKSTYWSLM